MRLPPSSRLRAPVLAIGIALLVTACAAGGESTSTPAFTTAVRSGQSEPAEPSASSTASVPTASASPVPMSPTPLSPASASPTRPTSSPGSTLSVPSIQIAPPAVHGGRATGVDAAVRNAATDIVAYWTAAAPQVFGGDLLPLHGGFYAIDPEGTATAPCLSDPAAIAGDVFYCPTGDAIVYDRSYLARLAAQYSELDVALTLAHEFGHALQHRFPTGGTKSITQETQADCYAGAWAAWVAGGNAAHVTFRSADLDRTLNDYVWEMGDPAGTDPNHRDAHGSVFDRVTALQEGFLRGPRSCASDFSDTREFVAQAFTAASASDDGKGNLPFAAAVSQGSTLLQQFWAARFTTAGRSFAAPVVAIEPAGCDRALEMALCPDDRTIGLGPLAPLTTNHERFGDFSTVTALGVAYAESVQQQGMLPAGPTARICATGAFSASLVDRRPTVLSPGDLDEAVRFLLVAGAGNPVVDTGTMTAWDRLDAFRAGMLDGLAGCGTG